MSEICQRCGEDDEDRRTLWMACFYQMNELGLPFEEQTLFHANLNECSKAKDAATIDVGGKKITLAPGAVHSSGELTPQGMYTLRVCKECRGDWMQAIKDWFKAAPAREEVSSGIFVRENGATVEISEEEWNRRNPGREPVRVK